MKLCIFTKINQSEYVRILQTVSEYYGLVWSECDNQTAKQRSEASAIQVHLSISSSKKRGHIETIRGRPRS